MISQRIDGVGVKCAAIDEGLKGPCDRAEGRQKVGCRVAVDGGAGWQ